MSITLANLDVLAPYLSGTGAVVPIRNLHASQAFGGVLAFSVYPRTGSIRPDTPSITEKPCWRITKTVSIGPGLVEYVSVPRIAAYCACWSAADSRWLQAKVQDQSTGIQWEQSTGYFANPFGCPVVSTDPFARRAVAISVKLRDVEVVSVAVATGEASYLALPIGNNMEAAARSRVVVEEIPVDPSSRVYRALLENNELMQTMANRSLKFGGPARVRVVVGAESVIRAPMADQFDFDDAERDCDCEGHDDRDSEKRLAGVVRQVGPYYGPIQPRDLPRFVDEYAFAEAGSSLALDLRPWQERQLIVKVEHDSDYALVHVLSVTQKALDQSGHEGALLFKTELVLVPPYRPFE
jgi:hypothetical protein